MYGRETDVENVNQDVEIELAAVALSAGSATAAGLGALAMGAIGPIVVVGLTATAVGAAVAGGRAAKKETRKNMAQLPQVKQIIKSFRWAPFLPVATDISMLSVLLLLSKYRLRSVPIIETGNPFVKNFITQSAVVQILQQCKGRDWFDYIAGRPIFDFGLPLTSYEELFAVPISCSSGVRIGELPVTTSSSNSIVRVPLEKRSLYKFGQRTSNFRGVTRHRWTGKYEAHLWDNTNISEGQKRKGKQVSSDVNLTENGSPSFRMLSSQRLNPMFLGGNPYSGLTSSSIEALPELRP
ncbi:hypothetical protein IFM89_031379 [Coptis chinensis]|uniref:Uncharacterized protein n=1 Tax=Coptis chinensis TaxID=261450 RepID=A0A835I7Y6_9MAGN|nr:hypothetical protein IFM89_031379 [Coptis chinensis]